MNVFQFDDPEQYRDLLSKKHKLFRYKDLPILVSKSLMKYYSSTIDYKKKYIILLNKFKSKKYDNDLSNIKNKQVVVVDGGDKKIFWPPYANNVSIYYKDNSYSNHELKTGEYYKQWRDRKGYLGWPRWEKPLKENIRIGCYSPSPASLVLLKNISYKEDKTIDVYFRGDYHCGRNKKAEKLIKICKGLGVNYDIGNNFKYDRKKYLQKMSNSKICVNFEGKGKRCRREWEVLLSGSSLLNELRTYPFVMMDGGTPMTKDWGKNIVNMLENLPKSQFEITREMWMGNRLPVNLRMIALYLFFDCPQVWTYEDLEKREREYGYR